MCGVVGHPVLTADCVVIWPVVLQVLVIDPSQRSSLQLLKLSQSLLSNQLPLTIGLVLLVTPEPAVTGRQNAGVALTEAFNYALREETTPKAGLKALQLLIGVSRDRPSTDTVRPPVPSA